MNIIGQKVRSESLGLGTVIEQNHSYILVKFDTKVSKFEFPTVFKNHLKLEDDEIQAKFDKKFMKVKKKEEAIIEKDKAAQKEFERMNENKKTSKQPLKGHSKINIDEMFDADYHVKHLSRQPILTYQEVEQQFGIHIHGFGRGINVTPTSVVLISSLSKSNDKFVYHDKWTEQGDYLYSGEGKSNDQKMIRGNLAIKEAESDGKKIYLFVKLSPQEYYYQGVFKMIDYEYVDETDESGDIHKEYKFRLRRVK